MIKYNIEVLMNEYNELKEKMEKYSGDNFEELAKLYEKEIAVLDSIKTAYNVELRSKLDELKELNNNRKV